MKLDILNLQVPIGTHEAEIFDICMFMGKGGVQFLKLRFQIFCGDNTFRLDKNFPDPSNNPYLAELVAELGIRLKNGKTLETDMLKEFFYHVTVAEDERGKRYIQSVTPVLEGEEYEEAKDDGYEDEEDEEYKDDEYDDEEDEEYKDDEYDEDDEYDDEEEW